MTATYHCHLFCLCFKEYVEDEDEDDEEEKDAKVTFYYL